jgi:hypothetical protein
MKQANLDNDDFFALFKQCLFAKSNTHTNPAPINPELHCFLREKTPFLKWIFFNWCSGPN